MKKTTSDMGVLLLLKLTLQKLTLLKQVLLSMFLLCTVLLSPAQAGTETVNVKAEDFTLKSRSGKNLKLSEQRGNVIMLNFWASWCPPCREEMPLINDLHKKYSKYGFSVWGVNVDDDVSLADKVLKDIPVQFPILLNPQNSIAELYGVEAMPTTVFIDRNGNKRFIHKGYKAGEEKAYDKLIKKLIRE
jgi:peroxiredoxin